MRICEVARPGHPRSLDWHYRSRDEALIAFSNHHIYGDKLVTFRGPGGTPVITHHHVPFVPGPGNEESAAAEVRRVADLVLDHARQRPEDTLGVIAMGIKHAHRVEAAVELARQAFPELDPFFASDRRERFFVKNLERVQGDERDAIILTVGYLRDLRAHFDGAVVADMFCLLRLELELSVQAKARIMARNAGLELQVDDDLHEAAGPSASFCGGLSAQRGLLALKPQGDHGSRRLAPARGVAGRRSRKDQGSIEHPRRR